MRFVPKFVPKQETCFKEKEEKIKKYEERGFNKSQINEIELGLEHNVDVTKYADPKFNSYQMEEKRWKLEKQNEPKMEKNINVLK